MNAETNVWNSEVTACSDSQLVARLSQLTGADRKLVAHLIVYLGEVDARGLYREHAFSSMYNYLVDGLQMSEGEAYLRLNAARLAREYPFVIELLATGAVHLSALAVMARFFTPDNHVQLLERMRGKTKREVLLLAAELEPKPDVPARIRKVPQSALPLVAAATDAVTDTQRPTATPRSSAASAVAETSAFTLEVPRDKPAACSPLGPRRFRLQLTASQEMHDTLEQLQQLLRHQVPDGDLAIIVAKALEVFLAHTLKQRFAQTSSPRKQRSERKPVTAPAATEPSAVRQPTAASQRCARGGGNRTDDSERSAGTSRTIPHAVLREVYKRDAGQCAFLAADGRRCSERGALELHHVLAFARGGEATVENIKLVCRSHNLWHAEQDFGQDFMRRKCSQAGLSG